MSEFDDLIAVSYVLVFLKWDAYHRLYGVRPRNDELFALTPSPEYDLLVSKIVDAAPEGPSVWRFSGAYLDAGPKSEALTGSLTEEHNVSPSLADAILDLIVALPSIDT